MKRAVLQTRYVGQAPDLRHPLAPPEHVFVCEEPKRTVLQTLNVWYGYALGLVSVVFFALGALALLNPDH